MSNPFREIFRETGQTVKDEAERIGLSRPTFTKIVAGESGLPDDVTLRTLRYFASFYGCKVKIVLEPVESQNGQS